MSYSDLLLSSPAYISTSQPRSFLRWNLQVHGLGIPHPRSLISAICISQKRSEILVFSAFSGHLSLQMPVFEGYTQGRWVEGELNRRLIPAATPWRCNCRKPLFIDPSTICSGCSNLEKAFWLGKGKRTLEEIRSYVGANCKICGIIYSGIKQYRALWSHVDESQLVIWLWIEPNNAVYVQMEKRTSNDTNAMEDLLWLEFYTIPGEFNLLYSIGFTQHRIAKPWL